MKYGFALAAIGVSLCLAACGGKSGGASALSSGRLPPSAQLLVRYDANNDGVIARAEMEAGVKAEFEAADPKNDSCIDREELRQENERRLSRDAGQASPLTDWNLDGCVDMAEFSNAVRSYFSLADRTKDNVVSQQELRGPSMPIAPRKNEGSEQAKPTPDDTIRSPQF